MDQSVAGEPLDPSNANSSPSGAAALAALPDPPFHLAPAAAEVRIGQVLTSAVEILFRNFHTIGLLVGVGSLPLLLMNLGQASAGTADGVSGASVAIMFVSSMILGTLCNAMVLHATFQDLRDRPVRAGQSVRHGLARFFPVLALSIVQGIAIGLGLLLLVVPGLILVTMYLVSVPACVVERLDVFESMDRSARLTSGYRGRIFGGLLAVVIIQIVVSAVIDAVTLPGGNLYVWAFVSYGWSIVYTGYVSVVTAVAYHALRVAKEGIDIDRIAAVFD